MNLVDAIHKLGEQQEELDSEDWEAYWRIWSVVCWIGHGTGEIRDGICNCPRTDPLTALGFLNISINGNPILEFTTGTVHLKYLIKVEVIKCQRLHDGAEWGLCKLPGSLRHATTPTYTVKENQLHRVQESQNWAQKIQKNVKRTGSCRGLNTGPRALFV